MASSSQKLRSPLVFFIFIFCQILPISTQSWDGVVVTLGDYQSLQALKHELVDPKGLLSSWNDTGYGACSGGWIGLKCAQGQVIVIQLPWRDLGGRLTEKIGQLGALRKLSLHDNFIGGPIPTSLGYLPNLRGLQLYNNRFSGSIPPSLGMCPVLQTLELANNSLSGPIPDTLVNSTRLIRLSAGYNQLSGSIPLNLAQSASLVFLALQNNNLSGPIPDSWGRNSQIVFQLQSLTLDHNSFTGNIPTSFGKLTLLHQISLNHNQLNGIMPNEICDITELRTLDFSENSLHGSLPDCLSKLQKLSLLDLRDNRFDGRIPAEIGDITSLREIDFSHNLFSGEIPDSFGDIPNLASFNLSYNNLSGSIPTELSRRFNSSSFWGNLQLCGYNDSIPCPKSSPSATSNSRKGHRKLSTKDIILIAGGVLVCILLVTCGILIFCLVNKRSTMPKAAEDNQVMGGKSIPPSDGDGEVEASGGETGGKLVHFDGQINFSVDDLLCATAEIIGKSTYGTVYRATMGDGIQVAVKRLREKTTKGQREFEIEANGLGSFRHPNLLPLRAYYLGPKGEKLLVFDYMPNGSLATFLHARARGRPINWATRMKITKGIVRGLVYLHNNAKIIHGNLTTSNVVLDEHRNPKIADFGLSKLMRTSANAKVIAAAGVLGYRAPELSKLNKTTTRTDIYSLGVIMLELLTGKSPGEAINGVDLPIWVASTVKEEWTNEVFDLELIKDASAIGDELLHTLKLALHCVDPSPSDRPEAAMILQQLEEIQP